MTAAELADVHRPLSLLAEAIAGEPISLDPVETGTVEACTLTAPRRGMVLIETADDRRRAARLPVRIDRFDDHRDNLRAYRAVLLRQVGRTELGTHDTNPEVRPEGIAAPTTLDERLVDPSWDLALLWQVYGVLETIRVGAELRRRYPGARRDLDLLDLDELRGRPPAAPAAPARELVLDALRRNALGAATMPAAEGLVGTAARLGHRLRQPGATAAMSVVLAWELTAAVLRTERLARAETAEPAPDRLETMDLAEPDVEEFSPPSAFAMLPEDDLELGPVEGLDGLDLTGFALTAELLSALDTVGDAGPPVAADGGAEAESLSITADPDRDDGGDEDEDGAAAEEPRRRTRNARPQQRPDRLSRTFLYDEWDSVRGTYLRGWCRLREIRLDGTVDGAAFADDVRRRHALLVAQVRRRLASITPNALARVHRTLEGDELSTDALIDAVVERRRGRSGDDRVYVRRDRAQREVAAAFLLDMSRSTDHPVADPAAPPPAPTRAADPEASWWDTPAPDPGPPPRRVIDVAKDALVLMCDALETLGDLHAVYGFSGDGRANCEFFVAKDFDDPSGGASSARVAAMEPVRYTRMGPAVRHATRRLSRVACRTRVLVVVSDGYPQDQDYGPDRNGRDYGIADTARALEEAERQGVTTFCITIDPTGHDYLRRMCPEQRYLVVDDVHQLPGELEKVYRTLTGRSGAPGAGRPVVGSANAT